MMIGTLAQSPPRCTNPLIKDQCANCTLSSAWHKCARQLVSSVFVSCSNHQVTAVPCNKCHQFCLHCLPPQQYSVYNLYLVLSAVLDPRIGRFMDNLPPLSSVFNGSQQTITSQPSPLRYVILPMCSWSSSSSLTRSSTLHYFFLHDFPSFRSTLP